MYWCGVTSVFQLITQRSHFENDAQRCKSLYAWEANSGINVDADVQQDSRICELMLFLLNSVRVMELNYIKPNIDLLSLSASLFALSIFLWELIPAARFSLHTGV